MYVHFLCWFLMGVLDKVMLKTNIRHLINNRYGYIKYIKITFSSDSVSVPKLRAVAQTAMRAAGATATKQKQNRNSLSLSLSLVDESKTANLSS